ncbi:MAG TPA: ATP-binding cassette domain-containing protein, partial [Longimicrobiales bacterium]
MTGQHDDRGAGRNAGSLANATPPLLRVEHVSKRFGNITALEDVSMVVEAGKVTCLLGDNGAGKSTLVGILSGVHRPTSGRLLVDGREAVFRSPREALEAGIAAVHQDLALIPLMSIWRNFFLGLEPTRGFGPFRRIDVKRCREIVRENLAAMGIQVRNPDQPVGTLSGGERQAVAISRALYFGARVLILD